VLPTSPGTEIKVTPESEAPIIPKATIYQGDCRFPVKNALLSAFLPVNQETINNKMKYHATKLKTRYGDIFFIFLQTYTSTGEDKKITFTICAPLRNHPFFFVVKGVFFLPQWLTKEAQRRTEEVLSEVALRR